MVCPGYIYSTYAEPSAAKQTLAAVASAVRVKVAVAELAEPVRTCSPPPVTTAEAQFPPLPTILILLVPLLMVLPPSRTDTISNVMTVASLVAIVTGVAVNVGATPDK